MNHDSEDVSLGSMRQLSEAQCADDDWTGLGDRAERRKRQTRLAVRAHRRRKAQSAHPSTSEDSQPEAVPPAPAQQAVSKSRRAKKGDPSGLRIVQWKPRKKEPRPTYHITHPRSQGCCTLPPGTIELIKRLNSPSPSLPLSVRDLLPIIQFNLLRAALTNTIILSLHHLLGSCAAILDRIDLFPAPPHVPPTLRPTALQRKTVHDACVDMLPSPTMRDNAIRHAARFSQPEFVRDLLGRDVTDDGQPLIIVWRDPWDPDGWEVTEGFVRRYGFLLEGCEDIRVATDRWRALRGERPLAWGEEWNRDERRVQDVRIGPPAPYRCS